MLNSPIGYKVQLLLHDLLQAYAMTKPVLSVDALYIALREHVPSGLASRIKMNVTANGGSVLLQCSDLPDNLAWEVYRDASEDWWCMILWSGAETIEQTKQTLEHDLTVGAHQADKVARDVLDALGWPRYTCRKSDPDFRHPGFLTLGHTSLFNTHHQ
jgi:hypothetical protein